MNLFVNGIFLALLAAALLAPTNAAVMQGIFKDPRHPGKCFISEDIVLNPGEEGRYPEIDCARVLCGANSHGEIQTCGLIMPPPGWTLGEAIHPKGYYPECCEREFIRPKKS